MDRIIADLLGDREQLDAVLRQPANVELQLEVVAEEAANEWTITTSKGAGFDVPASIMRWNSGLPSLVADAPGST